MTATRPDERVDPPDDTPIKEALRTLYGAIERFDADQMLHVLSRRFELLEPERAKPVHWDRDQFVKVVRGMEGQGIVEYQLDQFSVKHMGEVVVTEYRNRFKFRGDTLRRDETTHEIAELRFRDGAWVIDKIEAHLTPADEAENAATD